MKFRRSPTSNRSTVTTFTFKEHLGPLLLLRPRSIQLPFRVTCHARPFGERAKAQEVVISDEAP